MSVLVHFRHHVCQTLFYGRSDETLRNRRDTFPGLVIFGYAVGLGNVSKTGPKSGEISEKQSVWSGRSWHRNLVRLRRYWIVDRRSLRGEISGELKRRGRNHGFDSLVRGCHGAASHGQYSGKRSAGARAFQRGSVHGIARRGLLHRPPANVEAFPRTH